MKYLAVEIIATLQRKWAAARGHQHCGRPGWVLCFSCNSFYNCILDTFFMIVSNPFRWQRYRVDGCKRSYFFPDEGTIQVRYTSQCSGSAALSINFLVCIKVAQEMIQLWKRRRRIKKGPQWNVCYAGEFLLPSDRLGIGRQWPLFPIYSDNSTQGLQRMVICTITISIRLRLVIHQACGRVNKCWWWIWPWIKPKSGKSRSDQRQSDTTSSVRSIQQLIFDIYSDTFANIWCNIMAVEVLLTKGSVTYMTWLWANDCWP